jgi:hypothetical protein
MSIRSPRLAWCLLGTVALVAVGFARRPLRGDEPKAAPAPRDVSRAAADAFLKERRGEVKVLEDKVRTLRDELSLDLNDIRRERELAVLRAKAEYQKTATKREVAEIAVQEYLEGTFPSEEQSAEGRVKLAEADFVRAEERADWANRMLEIGYISDTQHAAESLNYQRADFALREAKTKLDVLRRFIKAKEVKLREAAVEKAKARELVAQVALESARIEYERTLRDTQELRMLSPEDHILGQLHETIKDQLRLTEVLHDVQRLQDEVTANPPQVEDLKQALGEKQSQAAQLADRIKNRLRRAVGLSEHLTERWNELMEAEFRLKEARDRLAMDLRLFGPEAK